MHNLLKKNRLFKNSPPHNPDGKSGWKRRFAGSRKTHRWPNRWSQCRPIGRSRPNPSPWLWPVQPSILGPRFPGCRTSRRFPEKLARCRSCPWPETIIFHVVNEHVAKGNSICAPLTGRGFLSETFFRRYTWFQTRPCKTIRIIQFGRMYAKSPVFKFVSNNRLFAWSEYEMISSGFRTVLNTKIVGMMVLFRFDRFVKLVPYEHDLGILYYIQFVLFIN